MIFRAAPAVVLLVLLAVPASFARVETRYVVASSYEYGGGSAGDYPDWRAVTWLWRSAADRDACRRSVFADPAARPSDPLGTAACTHARVAAVPHRTVVDVLASDHACGALVPVAFAPTDRARLSRVTGCMPAGRLDARPAALARGLWVFAVDVRELAGEAAPRLQRIGAYSTWTDCEQIRITVRDDLTREADAEALDGARLAASGACLPDELLE
jgi:hypothetical protein